MKLFDCIALLLFFVSLPSFAAGVVTLYFNEPLQLEIASSKLERSTGLSARDAVPTGTGMLFVHAGQKPTNVCFWMKNTLVGLDAVFIASNGMVVKVARMEPQTELAHCPPHAVPWVIEVPTGWLGRNDIDVGTHIGEHNLRVLRELKITDS